MQECPAVRSGPPRHRREHYAEQAIEGVTVFVPRGLRDDLELTIAVARFPWKRLVLDGWPAL